MTQLDLEKTFHSANNERDKFLSRLFGIFSEKIVSIWLEEDLSPYRNLGRPSLYDKGKWLCTFDFTLQEKRTNKIFVCEQKCELEYQGYKYLTFENTKQFNHHMNGNFKRFIELSENPKLYKLQIANGPNKGAYPVDGTILIWGKVLPKGKEAAKSTYNISDVLSLEGIISDLNKWRSTKYHTLLSSTHEWCNYLFNSIGIDWP